MEMPVDFLRFISKYRSKTDLIENLFLNAMIDSYSRVKKIINIYDNSENKIRNNFQYDLTYSNKFTKDLLNKNFITFTAENQIITKENEIKRTDIQFIINGVIKFVIECKKIKTVKRKQYIDDGIYRFVENIYISQDEEYAGMCNFVVNDDISTIILGIKKKVKEYNFVSIDENNICDFESSFSSKHNRTESKNIKIYHLFFKMNKNSRSYSK